MTNKTMYDAYGEYGRLLTDAMLLGGRNKFQGQELSAAVVDVRAKLRPRQNERFLDIGCNIGLFLEAFAGDVAEAVGQDHETLLAHFKSRGVPANVTLIPGFWPAVQAEGMFDCILAYSVLAVLPDRDVAWRFIDACLDKLTPGGRLLLGDLANRDARSRFVGSREGAEVASAYNKIRQSDRASDVLGEYEKRDAIHGDVEIPAEFIDDAFVVDVLKHCRARGFEAYLLPQPEGLPFWRSREDILVLRRD